MRTKLFNKLFNTPWLLVSASLGVCTTLAWCAPETAAQKEKTEKEKTEAELQPADLERDAALAAKVSFEAKQKPLRELLGDLQKTSGVVLLDKAGALSSRVRVTARVKEMSLASMMSALSRLYDVRWTKTAEGYVMSTVQRGAEEQLQVTAGRQGHFFRFWRDLIHSDRFPKHLDRSQTTDWAAEILPLVDVNRLQVQRGRRQSPPGVPPPKGVPVTELPEDLQRRLRNHLEEQVTFDLLQTRRWASRSYLEDRFLYVGRQPLNGEQTFAAYVLHSEDIYGDFATFPLILDENMMPLGQRAGAPSPAP